VCGLKDSLGFRTVEEVGHFSKSNLEPSFISIILGGVRSFVIYLGRAGMFPEAGIIESSASRDLTGIDLQAFLYQLHRIVEAVVGRGLVRRDAIDLAIHGVDLEDVGGFLREVLRAILEESGSGLDRLVKTTVYLSDLGDFAAMNEVYAKHVGAQPPARATIEVSALPSGAKVEIDAIALAG